MYCNCNNFAIIMQNNTALIPLLLLTFTQKTTRTQIFSMIQCIMFFFLIVFSYRGVLWSNSMFCWWDSGSRVLIKYHFVTELWSWVNTCVGLIWQLVWGLISFHSINECVWMFARLLLFGKLISHDSKQVLHEIRMKN